MTKKVIIDSIYLKESNIETPHQIEVFDKGIIQVDSDLSCESKYQNIVVSDKQCYEVGLFFQIAARSDDLCLYILNFIQSGLFRLEGYKDDQKEEALAIDCPNILFPYARLHAETITKSTGLAPTIMQEINFKELYYKEIGKKYE